MAEKKEIPFLHTTRGQTAWDWWKEDPVELILLVFLVVLFFTLPREGCGITAQQVDGAAGSDAPVVQVDGD